MESNKKQGMTWGFLVLLILVFQNTAFVLSTSYSRSVLKKRYLTSALVITVEFTKLALSAIMMEPLPGRSKLQALSTALKSAGPMCVPALIYTGQKYLTVAGIENLDPGVYAVLSQLKQLFTAILSGLFLGRQYHALQWRALLELVVGVSLINIVAAESREAGEGNAKVLEGQNMFMGVVCTIGVAVCSGFSGVYIEKAMKSAPKVSVWEKNFQLSLWGCGAAVIALVTNDRVALVEKGFFYDWDLFTIIVICIWSWGGIMVGMVAKYADMVLKGFATAAAIVCSILFGYILLPAGTTTLNLKVVLGTVMVGLSIFNYNTGALLHKTNNNQSSDLETHSSISAGSSSLNMPSETKAEV